MRSFAQIYIMVVFGVKYRVGILHASWRDKLFAVMAQTIKEMDGVVPIIIGGYNDHVHILFSTRGNIAEEEITRKLKTESTLWINKHRLAGCHFAWQAGSGRFSYSGRQVEAVKHYIANQVEHHKRMTFREEYELFLRKCGVTPTKFDLPQELE